jgi:hypothetical protein
LLDNCALEEARVVARVQHCGIGERELAKILFGDEALLNHLKRFGYDIREGRNLNSHTGLEGGINEQPLDDNEVDVPYFTDAMPVGNHSPGCYLILSSSRRICSLEGRFL